MLKQVTSITLKLGITLAIFAYFVRDVDLTALLRSIGDASLVSVGACFLVLLILSPFQAQRWHIIINALDISLPYRKTLSIVMIGIFFSQLLPTSIGGDAIRVWKLHQAGTPLAKSFNSVVLDRISAVFAVMLIVGFGCPILFKLLPDPAMRTVVFLTPMLAVGLLLLLALIARFPDMGRLLASVLGKQMGTILMCGVRDASAILLSTRPMLFTLGLSVAMQMAISFSIWLLAFGLGGQIAIIECVVLVPFVMLASMIPISIAGWGVREGAMVFAFGFAGVDNTTALTISLLFGVAVAATGLPGGLLWLYERRHH